MKYTINPDGRIDIISNDITLSGGYPAVDGITVHPLGIAVDENRVEYFLTDGASLTLRIDPTDNGLTLRCTAKGLGGSHDIEPLAGMEINGCDRLFYQGPGMGGPSGFEKTEPIKPRGRMFFGPRGTTHPASHDSDGLIAVGHDKACVTVHVNDHTRFRSHFVSLGNRVDVMFDTEKTAGPVETLPTVVFREGSRFDNALRRCAEDTAAFMNARTPKKPAFHWCSWYYLYHTLDQATLDDYVSNFAKEKTASTFTHIQIDAGYSPALGDWLDKSERFPQGLAYAARTIQDAGFEAGLWIGPFMVGEESKLFREHPEWVIHDPDGKPMPVWHFYNEPKLWGYRDSEYYALDTSHPEAMAYMRHVFTTLREAGYTLFKTDFMFWGLFDSTLVKRHTPGKTSVEYFREFLAMVRETIGDAVWLGCIAPFMPFIGYADMMRIGGDVGAQWNDTGFGPENMIKQILGTQYFNNIYWQNDPDTVMLRDFHISLTDPQIEALALLQAVSGGVITTSDPVHLLGEDRRKLLQLIRPSEVIRPEYPYWQDEKAEIVILNRTKTGTVLYAMNPTREDRVIGCEWDRWRVDRKWYARKLHGEMTLVEEVPFIPLKARSSALYFLSPEPLSEEPVNLWDR